jgi:hypothetical protein
MNASAQKPPPDQEPPPRRAGPLQVAKTMIFGLLAIGMKGTIEKDGAKVTPAQLVIGGLIGAAILVALIITLAHFVLKFAMSGASA